MEETYCGIVQTVNDALLVFEACRLGFLNKVERRLSERERQLVRSGAVFVWDEEQTGMRRWTDGRSWTASRINGNFLIYRELDGKRKSSTVPATRPNGPSASSTESACASAKEASTPSQSLCDSTSSAFEVSNTVVSNTGLSTSTSLAPAGGAFRNMANLKRDGLIKLSFSVTVATGNRFHLVHYYSPDDLTSGLFKTPSKDPAFAGITISREYYPDTVDDLRTGYLKRSSSPSPREKAGGRKVEVPYSVQCVESELATSRVTMPQQQPQWRSRFQPVMFATSEIQTSKLETGVTKCKSQPYQQHSFQAFGRLLVSDFSHGYPRRNFNSNKITFETGNDRQNSVCSPSSNDSDTSVDLSPSRFPEARAEYFPSFLAQPAPFQEVAWEKFPNTEVKRQLEAVYAMLSI